MKTHTKSKLFHGMTTKTVTLHKWSAQSNTLQNCKKKQNKTNEGTPLSAFFVCYFGGLQGSADKDTNNFRIFMRVRAYVRACVILLKGGGKANYKGNAGQKATKST